MVTDKGVVQEGENTQAQEPVIPLGLVSCDYFCTNSVDLQKREIKTLASVYNAQCLSTVTDSPMRTHATLL